MTKTSADSTEEVRELFEVLIASTDESFVDCLQSSVESMSLSRSDLSFLRHSDGALDQDSAWDIVIIDCESLDEGAARKVAQSALGVTTPPVVVLRSSQPPAQFLLHGIEVDAYLSPGAQAAGVGSTLQACVRFRADDRLLRRMFADLRERRLRMLAERFATEVVLLESTHSGPSDGTLRSVGSQVLKRYYDSDDPEVSAAGGAIEWAHIEHFDGLPSDVRVLPFHFELEAGGQRAHMHAGVCYRALSGAFSQEQKSEFGKELAVVADSFRLFVAGQMIRRNALAREMVQAQRSEQKLAATGAFAGSLAHDMNTPLGVASTSASMISALAKEIADQIDEQAVKEDLSDLVESSKLLERNLERVGALVDRLRQIKTGVLSDERNSVDLGETVAELVATMNPATSAHGIDIMIDAPDGKLPWSGYVEHLHRVLINMLQNIMRYAYPNGPGIVIFRLRVDDDSELPYRIEIQDYGEGIAPDLVSRVFDAHVTTGKDRGGTGIGLALCRGICEELLKGAISCSSQVGEGTTFTIALPSEVPEADAETTWNIELA